MEYIIIKEAHSEEFMKAVNRKILDGWVPQGGVTMAQGTDRFNTFTLERVHEGSPKVISSFVQAMIRMPVQETEKRMI